MTEVMNTDEDKTLYGFIKSCIPEVEGYGVTNQETVDNVLNHNIWYQSIREECEGDIGIFLITGAEDTQLQYGEIYQGEVQIVVNSVNGDIAGVLNMLKNTLKNIRDIRKNQYVYVMDAKLINLAPVGKNSNGLQWSVMNILCKYTSLVKNY